MPLFGPPDVEKLKAKGDVPGLIKALGHQRGKDFGTDHHAVFQARRIRENAATALGALGDRSALEPLTAALGDSNKSVRASVAEALGQLGDPRAVEPLLAAMAGDDEGVHRAAVDALGRLPWEPTGAAGAAYRLARGEWAECAQIGAPAIEPLLAVFKGAKWSSGDLVYESSTRKAAAGALVKIGTPVIEPVLAVLVSLDSFAREALAGALVKIGEPAVKPLIVALDSPDSGVRSAAVRVLGRTSDPRSVEPLVVVLKEGDSGIGREAAGALARLGDRAAVMPLIEVVEDKGRDADLRKSAAEALGQLGDLRAVEPLIAVLEDRGQDGHLRERAARALGGLGDQRAVQPLRDAFNRSGEAVGGAASRALAQLAWEPGDDAEGAAYWVSRGDYGKCIEIGAPAIEALIGLLDDDSKATRQGAAGALVAIYRSGTIGPEQQARILVYRTSITAKHDDELLGCWITEHSDYGIGVAFPV